jgi:hypothetical protein
MKPVVLSYGDRSVHIQVLRGTAEDCPPLIDENVLAELGLWKIQSGYGVLDLSPPQPVLWAVETEKITRQEMSVDTVSGIDETNTDDELIMDMRKKMKDWCKHLSDDDFQQLWGLFVRYKECWIRPGVGKIQTTAHFEAKGKPYKA